MKNKQKAWRLGAQQFNLIQRSKDSKLSARRVKDLCTVMGTTMRDPARHRHVGA